MDIITGQQAIKDYLEKLQNSDSRNENVDKTVVEIIEKVKMEQDQALIDYTERFDGVKLTDFRISPEAIEQAYTRTDDVLLEALEQAKQNILSFHEQQRSSGFLDTSTPGIIRGQMVRPIERVGLYVPGGTASYPSSVLMNALPAKIAGVKKIVMVSPSVKGKIPDVILAAAKIAGVDEIYQIGGAQAIAALAYGTETIPKVDKIVGPGNIYVATAKKQLFGKIAIDMVAGPSEVAIIADDTTDPRFIAADLLAQAEHDQLARTFLITNSPLLAKKVQEALTDQLQDLPRREIAQASIDNQSAILIDQEMAALFEIANLIAPEHLEIQLADPMTYLSSIEHAGSVFLGHYTTEPLGDYFAGTNHVLPTNGTARFSSPLGVEDFIKRIEFLSYSQEELKKAAGPIVTMATAEGLDGHAKAITIRLEEE